MKFLSSLRRHKVMTTIVSLRPAAPIVALPSQMRTASTLNWPSEGKCFASASARLMTPSASYTSETLREQAVGTHSAEISLPYTDSHSTLSYKQTNTLLLSYIVIAGDECEHEARNRRSASQFSHITKWLQVRAAKAASLLGECKSSSLTGQEVVPLPSTADG